MTANQRSAVVGVFEDHHRAERAVEDLHRAGFSDDEIGIARRGESAEGALDRSRGHDSDAGDAGEGAAAGAMTGGVVGGILGALAAGLIPGIGPVIAGGLLAGLVGGAAVGAVAGGLLGALTGMGVPEDEARYYDQEFQGGRTIVTVRANGRYQEAQQILRQHGAYDVNTGDQRAMSSTQTTDTRNQAFAAGGESGSARRSGETLELREEELRARTEAREVGSVEVEKDVVSEQRTVEVPVTREEAYVERRPVDRRPSNEPINDDDEIEVTLHEERVTVEKEPVVYEEVEVGKRTVRDTERVSEEVQREVAHINDSGDVDVREGGSRGASSWDELSPSYRQRWQQRYGTTSGRWEDAEPGYRYGHEMSSDDRYRDREWDDVAPEFRNDYDEWARRRGYQSQESGWDRVRENVRETWEEARARTRGR